MAELGYGLVGFGMGHTGHGNGLLQVWRYLDRPPMGASFPGAQKLFMTRAWGVSDSFAMRERPRRGWGGKVQTGRKALEYPDFCLFCLFSVRSLLFLAIPIAGQA
jgi:hypothetical protein